ncbi:ATP-binding protein [Streptomyces sp. 549]|uniref:ATP-binding protein n=1 Tax=Streptomyces sp. 549 TaxID=3049076 RepID=UPI0024C45506|nr:ATP-binding protein [Streptomyces sp. 549]MDK1475343.1 ATP-binding protein [Streptomyces sp. 549]
MTDKERPWPGCIRSIVRAHLRSWRCENASADAELIATELVTNAFQHGSGAEIGVRMTLTPTHLRFEIDSGPGSRPRPSARAVGQLEEGGRGLLLVAGLCDAWGVSPDGSRTWCTLTVAADQPGPGR